jgi:hypothetical protein
MERFWQFVWPSGSFRCRFSNGRPTILPLPRQWERAGVGWHGKDKFTLPPNARKKGLDLLF